MAYRNINDGRGYGTQFYSTSGSSFTMYRDDGSVRFTPVSPVYQQRFCAYCDQQKEALQCPSCGARRDREPDGPTGVVNFTCYTPKKKGVLEKIFS